MSLENRTEGHIKCTMEAQQRRLSSEHLLPNHMKTLLLSSKVHRAGLLFLLLTIASSITTLPIQWKSGAQSISFMSSVDDFLPTWSLASAPFSLIKLVLPISLIFSTIFSHVSIHFLLSFLPLLVSLLLMLSDYEPSTSLILNLNVFHVILYASLVILGGIFAFMFYLERDVSSPSFFLFVLSVFLPYVVNKLTTLILLLPYLMALVSCGCSVINHYRSLCVPPLLVIASEQRPTARHFPHYSNFYPFSSSKELPSSETLKAQRNRLRRILNKCPSLFTVVHPPVWCFNRYLQLLPFMLQSFIEKKPMWSKAEVLEITETIDKAVDHRERDENILLGKVALHWVLPKWEKQELGTYKVMEVPLSRSNDVQLDLKQQQTPTLLLLHGLMCDASSLPNCSSIVEAQRRGWRVVVMERRGHGNAHVPEAKSAATAGEHFDEVPQEDPPVVTHPGTVRNTNIFSLYGCAADLDFVVQLIKKRYPHSPLFGWGFSAGGVPLQQYLLEFHQQLETENDLDVVGGGHSGGKVRVTKENPFAGVLIFAATADIEMAHNRLPPFFDRFFLAQCKNFFLKKNEAVLRGINNKAVDEAFEATCTQDLLDKCYPFSGFASLEEYLNKTNPIRRLRTLLSPYDEKIESSNSNTTKSSMTQDQNLVQSFTCPTLWVHSVDDPIACKENLFDVIVPIIHKEQNPNVAFAVTASGSHCPFASGRWLPTENWGEKVAFEFFEAILEENKAE